MEKEGQKNRPVLNKFQSFLSNSRSSGSQLSFGSSFGWNVVGKRDGKGEGERVRVETHGSESTRSQKRERFKLECASGDVYLCLSFSWSASTSLQ